MIAIIGIICWVLDSLEWLAKYGLIDIIFGIGVTGILWNFLRRRFPRRCEALVVDVAVSGTCQIPGSNGHVPSFTIHLRNTASGKDSNIYVARAYFRKRYGFMGLFRPNGKLPVHPASERMLENDSYALKFRGQNKNVGFSDYETLILPGHEYGEMTFLALANEPTYPVREKRVSGTLFIEYASKGTMGVHRVRV
jgi:hypothetical protein